MSVKQVSRKSRTPCDWCCKPATRQIVTGAGVEGKACDEHVLELENFDRELLEVRRSAEMEKKLRDGFHQGAESSIAEFELNLD